MKSSQKRRFSFQKQEARRRVDKFGKVILVGSGKGGVGKSFVSCAIALLLSEKGYRTGILDIDIHGASVPNYLEVRPPLKSSKNGLQPKVTKGLQVMSVALLAGNNPVPMRGEEKQDFITHLLALTDWGALDYLVVDLPPSTGDEHFSAFDLFAGKSSIVLVTTPSLNAISVVSRLRRLAESEGVPVEGIVLNMAFAESLGGHRTHPFGRANKRVLEEALHSRIIAEIPLEPKVNSQGLVKILRGHNSTSAALRDLIQRLTVGGRG